jgi:hypothetical protein
VVLVKLLLPEACYDDHIFIKVAILKKNGIRESPSLSHELFCFEGTTHRQNSS